MVNSVQRYWSDTFARSGVTYRPAHPAVQQPHLQRVRPAPSATGPFYRPADETVHVDLTFFDVVAAAVSTRRAVRSPRRT